jgi:hypothetical protein
MTDETRQMTDDRPSVFILCPRSSVSRLPPCPLSPVPGLPMSHQLRAMNQTVTLPEHERYNLASEIERAV